MTPRQRISAILRNEPVDAIPLTIYERMLPRGSSERLLRNQGLALIKRVPLFIADHPNVQTITRQECSDDKQLLHTILKTPVGEVSSVEERVPAFHDVWTTREHFIKTPRDYSVLEFFIMDTVFRSNDREFRYWERTLGEDGYVIANIPDYVYSPMGYMMYRLMGIERFSLDQFDNSELFFSLYHTIWQTQKRLIPLLGTAPKELYIYAGNIHPQIVSPGMFETYFVPCINEFAQAVHNVGGRIAVHYDAKVGSLRDSITLLNVDVLEAFTPSPTGDMSVREANTTWPDKLLWINFPSSVFLENAAVIERSARQILSDAAPGRLILGITEDVPENLISDGLAAITKALASEGFPPFPPSALSYTMSPG